MKTEKITIELPTEYAVASRGQSIAVAIGKLSAEIVAQCALHGLRQKIADAASGALRVACDLPDTATTADVKVWGEANADKVAETAVSLMEKALDGIVAGDWSQRGTGEPGVEPIVTYMRRVVRAALKKPGNESLAKAVEDAGDDKAKINAILDAVADAHDAIIRPKAEAMMAADAEKAKARTGLGGLSIDLSDLI